MSCSFIGDVNGDGIEDWIVGASGEVVGGIGKIGSGK